MFRLSRTFQLAFGFVFAFAGIAFTLPNTSIHGTVSDPSGAVLANAKVELLENDIPVATVMTDAKGQYAINLKPSPGSRLRVSSPGSGQSRRCSRQRATSAI